MPRFGDLFFARLKSRKGWIGAGFVRCEPEFWVGKMLLGGLTCVFWAENSKRENNSKNKAINQSLRPA
jgi:hypothetical protein